MEIISDILFVVSNGLMIPVLLLLIYFLFRGLLMVVNLLPLLKRLRKQRNEMGRILESPLPHDESEWTKEISSLDDGIFKSTLSDIISHKDDEAYCERKIANYEIEVKCILDKSRRLIKFGPMLGLMGTLIPMGPALVGLASGDISAMAYNMQVAFATTVVGMVIAAIGIANLQINERYYAYTINDLDYIHRSCLDLFTNFKIQQEA